MNHIEAPTARLNVAEKPNLDLLAGVTEVYRRGMDLRIRGVQVTTWREAIKVTNTLPQHCHVGLAVQVRDKLGGTMPVSSSWQHVDLGDAA